LTLVTPFAPGGVSDVVARTAAQGLSEELGKPVIVLNRPGTGGSAAAGAVLSAPKDGYTLMLVTAYFIYDPFFVKDLSFSVERDFQPISLLAKVPELIVTSPGMPGNWADFVAYWRANAQKMNIASYGPGSEPEVAMMMLAQKLKTSPFFIPYRGGAPAMQAILSGEADAYLTTVPTGLPLVRSSRVKAVAVTSDERLSLLPDVPTIKETGIDYFAYAYIGVAVAAGTPPALIESLHRAIVKAMARPEISRRIQTAGAIVETNTPNQFESLLRAERERVGAALDAQGLATK
jgi:tripartite-type tricarboxylate transporter receptor subunit TctC